MGIRICAACVVDYLSDLKVVATAEGEEGYVSSIHCFICRRPSGAVNMFHLPVTCYKILREEKDRAKFVEQFLRRECSEELWKERDLEGYMKHIVEYIPKLREMAASDRKEHKWTTRECVMAGVVDRRYLDKKGVKNEY